jgi:hypothetical protein
MAKIVLKILYNETMSKNQNGKIWLTRALVGLVVFSNLLAAFSFLIAPGSYAPGFELFGEVGNAAIRGIGLLFLMWTIPYLVAMIHPLRHFTSLVEAVIMQAVGVAGESLILAVLQGEHSTLRTSVIRFIVFDAAGLVLLLLAFWLMIRFRKQVGIPL